MGDATKYMNFSSATLFYHLKLPSETSIAMYFPKATDTIIWGSLRKKKKSIEEQFSMLFMNSADQLKKHLWFLLERNGVVIEFFSFTVLRKGVNAVWVILHTTDSSSHTEQPQIHLETQIDFKWDSYLEMKTFSGNLIDSDILFLRISVANAQVTHRNVILRDWDPCQRVNLQVAIEIKSIHFWFTSAHRAFIHSPFTL